MGRPLYSWKNTIKLLSLATDKVVGIMEEHGVDEEMHALAFVRMDLNWREWEYWQCWREKHQVLVC